MLGICMQVRTVSWQDITMYEVWVLSNLHAEKNAIDTIDIHMGIKMIVLIEIHMAMAAFVWFLSSMYVNVKNEENIL